MARIDSLPRSTAEIRNIPERYWLKGDKGVKLVAFYPFRDFYGGYLIYEITSIDYSDKKTDYSDKKPQRYKQFISNKMAKKLSVKEVYVYGRRAS